MSYLSMPQPYGDPGDVYDKLLGRVAAMGDDDLLASMTEDRAILVDMIGQKFEARHGTVLGVLNERLKTAVKMPMGVTSPEVFEAAVATLSDKTQAKVRKDAVRSQYLAGIEDVLVGARKKYAAAQAPAPAPRIAPPKVALKPASPATIGARSARDYEAEFMALLGVAIDAIRDGEDPRKALGLAA